MNWALCFQKHNFHNDELTRYIQHSNDKNIILIIYKVYYYFVDMIRLFDLIRYIPTLFELLQNLINQDFQVLVSRSSKSSFLPSALSWMECHKYSCFLVALQNSHWMHRLWLDKVYLKQNMNSNSKWQYLGKWSQCRCSVKCVEGSY